MLDSGIRPASEDLERLKSDEQTRRLYELREKALLDERSAKTFFREEGQEEGRTETKTEIALSLFKEGMTEDFVSKVIGLEPTVLRRLKEQLVKGNKE